MIKTVILVISTVLIVQHVLSLIFAMGVHKRVYNHRPGKCRVVPGIHTGSENMELLKNGLALITSGLRLDHLSPNVDPSIASWKGRIYLFDFENPDGNVTEVPIVGNFDHSDFRPHGMSVWEKPDKTVVFVVNHKRQYDSIEVFNFDVQKKSLQFLYSFTDPLMRSVNDVLAVGPNQCYFTNDGYNTNWIKRTLERLLKFPWGSVVFYDHNVGHGRIVVPRGFELNGINKSPDGKYIYVASPFVGTVTVYERQTDSTLKPLQVIDLGTAPDNIHVDPASGNLWVGCHPLGYQTVQHVMNITQPAASQVLTIQLTSKPPPYSYELKEIYVDDGTQISASSIAVNYKNQLLIGSVLHNMIHCQVLAF